MSEPKTDAYIYVVTDIETDGPYEQDRLFAGPGLCIQSYAAALMGRPVAQVWPADMPSQWFGDVEHTHKAIDDALGDANLLVTLAKMSASYAPSIAAEWAADDPT